MVGMVRFPNFLVQDYLDIDSELVHGHLEQRLSDFQQFRREIIDQFPVLSGDAPESPQPIASSGCQHQVSSSGTT
jgi:hypothetical protein